MATYKRCLPSEGFSHVLILRCFAPSVEHLIFVSGCVRRNASTVASARVLHAWMEHAVGLRELARACQTDCCSFTLHPEGVQLADLPREAIRRGLRSESFLDQSI